MGGGWAMVFGFQSVGGILAGFLIKGGLYRGFKKHAKIERGVAKQNKIKLIELKLVLIQLAYTI
jgi:hypothetical protein